VSPLSDSREGLIWTHQPIDRWLPRGALARACNKLRNLTWPRMPAKSGFLEHRRSIDGDFKSSAARSDELDLRLGITIPHLSRQTGGSGLIVSNGAVFDFDFHRGSV